MSLEYQGARRRGTWRRVSSGALVGVCMGIKEEKGIKVRDVPLKRLPRRISRERAALRYAHLHKTPF